MDIELTLIDATPLDDGWVEKPFATVSGFDHVWWQGNADGPVLFGAFTEHGNEVGRVQIRLDSGLGETYPTWDRPPGGATEIELFEVRQDLRGSGVGTAAVAQLLAELPRPLALYSRNDASDGFWRRCGWSEHLDADITDYNPDGARPMSLFVSPN